MLQGVDLLFHEATFSEKDIKLAKQTGHSTALQAATIAKSAKVKQLLIGHLSNRYRAESLLLEEAKQVFEHTLIAEELRTYKVKQIRED